MFKPCVRHLECFERDKKRYQGDISFLCPPVINLIQAQVCDNRFFLLRKNDMFTCEDNDDVSQE